RWPRRPGPTPTTPSCVPATRPAWARSVTMWAPRPSTSTTSRSSARCCRASRAGRPPGRSSTGWWRWRPTRTSSNSSAAATRSRRSIDPQGARPRAVARGRAAYDHPMRVYLGADHAGYELKTILIEHLTAAGHEAIDCGAFEYDAVDDYPAFCIDAARKVVADPGSLGIVLGGSGNGEQIAANKVPGARCALAWSVETAQLARQHNNAQLIGLGGRMHSVDEAKAI